MIISDIDTLGLVLIAGFIFGLLYYHALWQTVKRLPGARHPVRLLLVSWGLRLSVLLMGFYFVADGHWDRIVAALIGVIAARAWVVRRIRPSNTARDKAAEDYAP